MMRRADVRPPKSPPWSLLPEHSSSVSPGLLDLRCKISYSLVSSYSSSTLTMLEIGLISTPNLIPLPRWLYCRPTLSERMGNLFGLDIISLLPRSLRTVRIPLFSLGRTNLQFVDLVLPLSLSRMSLHLASLIYADNQVRSRIRYLFRSAPNTPRPNACFL